MKTKTKKYYTLRKQLLATTLLLITLSVSSCVSYKPQYKSKWQQKTNNYDSYFSLYLIGDAGNAPLDSSTVVFDHLKKELDRESENSAIVWLGDNIYPVGLAPSSSVYHKLGKHRIMAQLNTMADYKGKKFFVPGNHDWYTYGRIGLRRQELMVDSILSQSPNPNKQENFFFPDKGCGDPQLVNLTEDINLLLWILIGF